MEPLQEGKRPVIDFSKIPPRKDVFRAGCGNDMIQIPGHVLAKIGCEFRSNIENHIKDYRLQKGDDVEWLLDPLDELSHSDDYVLDAFQVSTPWESIYKLYFHLKDAASIYIPFDKPIKEPIGIRSEGNTIYFDDITWHMPPNITMDNVYDIEDPIAKKMALIELLKEKAISVLWKRALDNHPRLVKNLKDLEEKEKTKTDEVLEDTVDNEDGNSQKSQEIPDDIINSPAYKKYVIFSRVSKKMKDRQKLEEVAFELIKESDGIDRGQWVNDLMIYHAKEVAAVFGSNPFEVGGQLEDMWDTGKYEDVDTGLYMSWSDWAAFFCNDVTKRVYSYFVDEHKKRSYYEEEEERLRNKLSHLKELLD